MYGYDHKFAYLVDTGQQGGKTKTSLKSLELARNEKGPMSSRNKSYTISLIGKTFNLKKAVRESIRRNALEFTNPPITNIGYKGIKKTSKEIVKWFTTSKNIQHEFQTTAMLMEKAGTGGSLFRNIYSDFLKESAELLESESIGKAHHAYTQIAILWEEVSGLFHKVGETKDIRHINQASDLLTELSEKERNAMAALLL